MFIWLYSGPWEARSFASWTSQQSACVLNHDVVLIQFLLLVLGVATELTCCNMLQLAHKTGVAVPVTALMPSSCISKCCPDAILSNVMFSLSTEKVAAPCSSFDVFNSSRNIKHQCKNKRNLTILTYSDLLFGSLWIWQFLGFLQIFTDLYRSSVHPNGLLLEDLHFCLASPWFSSSRGATTKIAHLWFAKTCGLHICI